MKKIVSIIMVVSLVAQGNIYANETDSSNPYSEKQQQDVQKAIEIFKASHKQKLHQKSKRSMATGAILGALTVYLWGLRQSRLRPGGPIWLDPAFLSLVSSVGAMVGLGAGADLVHSMETWQQDKINNVLETRTSFTSLKKLPQEQATLIVAAYRRNLPMMKLLIDHQPEFVTQTGVWKALTELYFNKKPTSGRVQRLKEMVTKADVPKFGQVDQRQTPGQLQRLQRVISDAYVRTFRRLKQKLSWDKVRK